MFDSFGWVEAWPQELKDVVRAHRKEVLRAQMLENYAKKCAPDAFEEIMEELELTISKIQLLANKQMALNYAFYNEKFRPQSSDKY